MCPFIPVSSHMEKTSSGRKINNRSFAAKSSTTPRDFWFNGKARDEQCRVGEGVFHGQLNAFILNWKLWMKTTFIHKKNCQKFHNAMSQIKKTKSLPLWRNLFNFIPNRDQPRNQLCGSRNCRVQSKSSAVLCFVLWKFWMVLRMWYEKSFSFNLNL